MKLHSPKVVGHALLSGDPVDALHAVPKQYVDLRTAGGIFVTDLVPVSEGIVGLKEYMPNTIPSQFYLSHAVTNTENVRVQFLAEPNMGASSVEVTANGVAAQIENITADPANPRLYTGYVDLTLDPEVTEQTILVVSSTGYEYSFSLDVLIGGPEISQLSLGDYPGSQTQVKQGDTVTVSGVVGNDAEEVRLLDYGVSGQQKQLTLGADDSAGAGFKAFTGSFVVSNRTGDLPIRAIATNLLGTDGDPFTSIDTMDVSQVKPTFGAIGYSYPAGQQAIKDNESVNVSMTVTNADVVDYSAAAGLGVTDPNNYAATKTVSRVDETIGYQVDTNNVTITATRSSNGAVSTARWRVSVADDVPDAQIVIPGNPDSLRSSAAGEVYNVEVRADQKLLGAPTSLTATGGTLSGNWNRISDTVWRTTLTVDDSVPRGTYTFADLVITNLADVDGSTITSGDQYLVAGIVKRDITVPALEQFVAIGTSVYDVSNVIVSYKGADVLTYYPDKRDVQKGFTIVDSEGNLDPNGTHVWISDSAFAGSNTSGTLVLEFEETE
tara:strand:+ start:86627 stop:88282 length:1656 start_codon:yes stop_codon:yes gene_type:complete